MRTVRRYQSWLPDVFNDFLDNDWLPKTSTTAPAINVIENENEYKVELAAPGMTKEDFKVHLDEDGNLVVSMEKQAEETEEKEGGRYLRREFSHTKFAQTMILPENVNKDSIEAKVENGILSVVIPKMNPEDLKKSVKAIEIS